MSDAENHRSLIGARAIRWMRIHVAAYAAVIGALNAINVHGGAPWWALWPTLGWGVLVALHFFIVKAMTVDEKWVDGRALELREHSYDFDHMKDIERRIVERDFSVEPPAERTETPTDPRR